MIQPVCCACLVRDGADVAEFQAEWPKDIDFASLPQVYQRAILTAEHQLAQVAANAAIK